MVKTLKNPIKIIVSGLDNAGKSSLLVALEELYDFEDTIKNLRPTQQIDYVVKDLLDYQISFWDMGGQLLFRNNYLQNPYYFSNISGILYLIDIQDEERFQTSLDYLFQLIQLLKEQAEPIKYPLFICFSKSDHKCIQKACEDFESRMEMIKILIKQSKIEIPVEFYITSVYNVFSVVHVVSKMLNYSVLRFKEIKSHLERLLETINLDYFIIYNQDGMVIADNYPINLHVELQANIDHIVSGHLEFFKQIEEEQIEICRKETFEAGLYCYGYKIPINIHSIVDIKAEPEIKETNQTKQDNREKYYYLTFISCKKIDDKKIFFQIEEAIPTIVKILHKK